MAVIDRATERVWNERNRYRADKQILSDTEDACAALFPAGLTIGGGVQCYRDSLGYYTGIRGYYREALTTESSEVDRNIAVGMKVAPSSVTACDVIGNRCLPIHYVVRNSKPFAPQNYAIIPTGTAIELQVVRANLQSIKSAPDPSPVRVGETLRDPLNTGDVWLSVRSPFVVGTTKEDLSCVNQASQRAMYVERDTYSPDTHTQDASPKHTTVYLKACAVTSVADRGSPQFEIKAVKAQRLPRGWLTTHEGGNIRGYQNMDAQAPKASFSPRPDTNFISPVDNWYGPLMLDTVSPLTSARVVANPDDDTPLVEFVTFSTTANFCSDGAETDDGSGRAASAPSPTREASGSPCVATGPALWKSVILARVT